MLYPACQARKIQKQNNQIDNAFDIYREGKNKASHYKEDTLKVFRDVDSLDLLYPILKKEEYTIAYVLPLLYNEIPLGPENQKRISQVAQEFYMGAELALENRCDDFGTKFNIHLLDSENNPSRITTEIYSTLDDIKPDLIIGSFTNSNLKVLSQYAYKNKTNLFSPLATSDTCLLYNPYLITATPTKDCYINYLSKYISEKYNNRNIILVCRSKEDKEKNLSCINKLTDTSTFIKVHSIIIDKNTWEKVTFDKHLEDTGNIILIPIDDQVIVNSIITKLVPLENEITIFGLSEWLNYRSLDISFLQKLNTHFLIDFYIDYYKPTVNLFIKEYRNKYKTEPSKYSFKGYDYSLFSAKMLAEKGKYFQRGGITDTNFVSAKFQIESREDHKGWENTSIRLLKFVDFELTEVPYIRQE